MIKILKFGAPWCTQCKGLDLVIKDLDLPIETINVDEDEEAAEKYNILSIPVLLFIDDDGKEVDRILGIVPKQEIINKYNELNS